MRRFLSTTLIALALLTCTAALVPVHVHHAQAAPDVAAEKTVVSPAPDADSSYNWIMIKIMSLFAWLVGVAAVTLNYATYYTVVVMGDYISKLTAVGVTWRILRDIGNIILIFGFLAVGITTILNVSWYGLKKMLPMLLIIAVFLNFSLFISEAIIDTGNLFATQIYTQINGGNLPTPATLGNQGISSKIMSQLGLTTIYGQVTQNAKAEQIFKGANPWIIGFMGVLLFIVLAFVLFSLAFILIARFVILLFLIIVAPIGFAGLVVPKLDSVAKRWWGTLATQTITAPVLMLLLYIALSVIVDVQFLTGFSSNAGSDWLGTQTNNVAAFAPVFLSFLVAMGLLLVVVVASKNMSAFGGDFATKAAGKLTFGATAWAGRRTLGRGAYYAARGLRQNKVFNRVDAWTGRATTRLLDKTATGSFDARGIKTFGGLKAVRIDAGEAGKGGFAEDRKQSIKQHETAAKQIEEAYKDKGSARFEAQIVAERGMALTSAQEQKADAQSAKDHWQAEVNRINSLPETNEQTLAELKRAEEEFTTADGRLTTAINTLAAAEEEMKKKDVEKVAGDRMKENIKAGKTAYAEGLTQWYNNTWNPINFVAYGPSGGAAARKIKESFKEKNNDEKIAELVRKGAKEAEEKQKSDDGTESAKPKEEESAPAPKESHA
jgi:hypothetical protein